METTIKKKFIYDGIELQIVDREETYMNSDSTVRMTRVIAPNGGVLPLTLKRKQTIKSIIEDTISMLDNFKSMGYDVKKVLTISK